MTDADSKAGKEKKATEKAIEKQLKKAENYARKNECEKATQLYQELARLAESINDRRAVDFCLEEAKCNMKLGRDFNVGWAYKAAAVYALAFNDFSNVVNFASKAIEFFSKANSMYAVQWCYNLMGEAGERMGNYELALKNYRKSLDIEYGEEIERKIEKLSKIIPHLTVWHECEKSAAKEGEKVDVILRITNDTKEDMRDIKILGEKANELEAIPMLRPGEAKAFKYTMVAWEDAKPLYRRMSWKNAKGETNVKEIEPPRLCIVPNIEVKPYLKDKLEIGQESYFVISLGNNSRNPIEDIDLSISFPIELKVQPVTGYAIDKIGPKEEKGFVFKILPTTVGRMMLAPVISFRDVRGRQYRKKMKPFVLEESLAAPHGIPPGMEREPAKAVSKENLERLKYTEKFKRYVEAFMQPKEMDEAEYVRLSKQMHSSITGYTFNDVALETVASHLLEECRVMSVVGEHVLEGERLYMLAGEAKDGGTYLLTAAMKEDDNLVHIALKLYSDREEDIDDVLEKISDIVKYTIIAMTFAAEIQKIEVKETINIIDSVVQRSKIGERIRKKDKNLDIKDSVVQRTEI